jgi:hypothetical protein
MTRARDVANIDGILTTTGDTYYASAAATPARLGIGSTGDLLTVSGGVPVWSAPAGGALSFALLNAGGTSLSGTTTTISGISGKSVIMVLVNNASSDTAGDVVEVRVNGTTTNLYSQKGINLIGYNPYDIGMLSGGGGMTQSGIQIGQGSSNASCVLQGSVIIQGCNSTGGKAFTSVGSFNNGGSNSMIGFSYNGFINVSAAITSVSVKLEQGSFDAGQVYVYAA